MIKTFKIFNENKKYSYTITELNYTITHNDYSNFIDILNHLSENINTIDGPDQEWTPLLYAVHNNRLTMVKQLIKYGADVNHKSKMGNTGLTLAISFQYNKIIDLLLPITKWATVNTDNEDLFDYIRNDEQKQKIIKKYPNKYKEYLIDKKGQKYNI
jgi:ankyrin repeat protein